MNLSNSLFARLSLSVFVSLFVISPVCTMFFQLCSTKWIIGTILVASLVFLLTGHWSNAHTETAPGTHSMEPIARGATQKHR
jgi:hypothetical protein